MKKLKKIMRSRIVSFLLILIFIAICMGIGAVLAYVEHESDPTEIAVQYFRAFVQQDYDKMYDCLTKNEGHYINKEMYTETMKNMRQQFVIDSYEIPDPVKKNGMEMISIQCTDSSKEETRNFDIYVDSRRNGMNIIPEYSINIDSMIVNDFTVIIPDGNTLELNGEEITEDVAEISSGDNDTTIYKLKGLLYGSYKIAATNKYYAMNKNINLEKSGKEIDMTKVSYTASDEYAEFINTSGNQVIKLFYKAVRGRNADSSKLMKCFADDKKLRKKVQELVKKSEEIMYWPDTKNIDQYKVVDMEIDNLKSKLTYNDETKVYTLKYTYSYDYVSATETALYTSYVYSISGTCKCELTLSYSLEGDEISLTDMKLTNKNKKNS